MRKTLLFALLVGLPLCLMAELPHRSVSTMKKLPEASVREQTARRQVSAPAYRAAEVPADAVEVPFTHQMGKSQADLYPKFDLNEDKKGWSHMTSYAACTGPNKDIAQANDDWMLSPAVHLFAGKSYTASFGEGLNTVGANKIGLLAFYMGGSQEPSAMTRELIATHEIKVKYDKNTAQPTQEVEFTVDEDGYYYFGFHSTTTLENTAIITLYDFSVIESGSKVIPPAAGELSYELAPKGELKATVQYTAPLKDIEGGDLEKISKVEVKTNWLVTHTFTDVVPGQVLKFETALNNNGYNRIEATAYVDDTPGEAAKILDFYAGPDNPLPVENVKATLSDDFKTVTLSWDAVGETGENGGYVDASKVTYYIFDAFGSYYDPAIATTDQTKIVLDYSDFAAQDFVAYQVTAGIDEIYYSLATNSNIVVIGQPDSTPWHESFSDACYQQMWVIDPASDSSMLTGTMYDNELQTNADDEDAEPEYLNSHDADNGFFYFMPMSKDGVYGFYSAKIDVSKAARPVFEFWYQGKGSLLQALVGKDGSQPESVRDIDLMQNPTDDWTLCRIDLSEYKTAGYIQVGVRLKAIHNDDEHIWSVPLDNMRVIDLVENDIRISSMSGKRSVASGESAMLTVALENIGEKDCEAVGVEMFSNGVKAAEKEIGTIATGKVTSFVFAVPATVLDDRLDVAVEVKAAGDMNAANNKAGTVIEVVHPEVPGVEGLAATDAGAGKVELQWTAPSLAGLLEPQAMTEDFENPDYEALTIENFGGWQMIDKDRGKTYSFIGDTKNPYRTLPMAFQLYDPVKAGVPSDSYIDIAPHSGNTLLVAWSAKGPNDNWLISPRLSGNEQTVTFFARSFTSYIPESFEVLYGSEADGEFTKINAVENYPADGEVSEDWTQYKAVVPAGANYFAIRHNAYDSYALLVDDICFEAASKLPADTRVEGYNVYRDGVKLTAEPVAETSYAEIPGVQGVFTYRVSAVYNMAESRACDGVAVTLGSSGIGTAEAGEVVITGGDKIRVTGAEGLPVTVASVDGKVVYSTPSAASTVEVEASTGIYLVQGGSRISKVTVR